MKVGDSPSSRSYFSAVNELIESEDEAENGLNHRDNEIIPESDENESSSAESNASLDLQNGRAIIDSKNYIIAETSSSENEIEEISVHSEAFTSEGEIIPESDLSENDEDDEHLIGKLLPKSNENEPLQNDVPQFNNDNISEISSVSSSVYESNHSENEVIMETDLSGSDSSDTDNGYFQHLNYSSHNEMSIPETDSSEGVVDGIVEGDNEVIVSATSSESEEENQPRPISLNIDHIESRAPQNSVENLQRFQSHHENNEDSENNDNNRRLLNSLPNPDESRAQSNSPDIFSDIEEIATERSTESSEVIDSHILEIPRNESEEFPHIPFIVNDFAVSEVPQNHDGNDQNRPVVNQRLLESEAEDDDQTIMLTLNDPVIEISDRSLEIIERIERFIAITVNDLKNGNRIQIVVQNRQNWDNCFIESERFVLLPISDARCRHVKSTFRQSVIFYLLAEIHEMLLWNRRCTVRELYYKNVIITKKQENVSEALKTVCCLLDAAPWELGVLSSSKGLIAGPLKIHLPENVIVDCNIDKNGITLPHLTSGITDLQTTARHVLVVEKDTVFKKLLQNNILERWKQSCILITGKGYPDINTRLILKKLRELHSIAIDIVTDADPYGIEIMLTYRHGSLSMSNLAEQLAVPSVRWLGIFPSDIRKFGIQTMELSDEDKRKLDNILNRPFINDRVHRELLIMKQINLKAEIEGISDSSCTYLIDVYLRNKIDNNIGI